MATPAPPPPPPVELFYTVPVGAVIAWWPPPGTDGMPRGFAVCDGSNVVDPDSPFNGRALPNLHSRFILGSAGDADPLLGATGGDPGFSFSGYQNPDALLTTSTQASPNDNQQNWIIQGNSPSTEWRYDLTQADEAMNDGNHHHALLPGAISVPAPGWVALIYIMRIK